VAGVGSWNFDVLQDNPFVDEVLPVNAPWHNQRIQPQGLSAAMRYLLFSDEVKTLALRRCDIGIDVLGSPFGSMLLMRSGIPYRLGVRGYAGGHTAAQSCVNYNPEEQVGRSALHFAELLGAVDLPENRPQIYLGQKPEPSGRIVIAPGGGFSEKCWPVENYASLARLLSDFRIAVIGGGQDVESGKKIAAEGRETEVFAGKLSLRETFAIIAGARLVICNSSMAMHAAAAFRIPHLVLLGPLYPSAIRHALQWGHPESRFLGRELNRPSIASPAAAFATVLEMLDSP
jgi:heptosyltransferase-2